MAKNIAPGQSVHNFFAAANQQQQTATGGHNFFMIEPHDNTHFFMSESVNPKVSSHSASSTEPSPTGGRSGGRGAAATGRSGGGGGRGGGGGGRGGGRASSSSSTQRHRGRGGRGRGPVNKDEAGGGDTSPNSVVSSASTDSPLPPRQHPNGTTTNNHGNGNGNSGSNGDGSAPTSTATATPRGGGGRGRSRGAGRGRGGRSRSQSPPGGSSGGGVRPSSGRRGGRGGGGRGGGGGSARRGGGGGGRGAEDPESAPAAAAAAANPAENPAAIAPGQQQRANALYSPTSAVRPTTTPNEPLGRSRAIATTITTSPPATNGGNPPSFTQTTPPAPPPPQHLHLPIPPASSGKGGGVPLILSRRTHPPPPPPPPVEEPPPPPDDYESHAQFLSERLAEAALLEDDDDDDADDAVSPLAAVLAHEETPTDAPIEAPMDAPIEAPTDAPIEAPIESPVDIPIDTPIYTPIETTIETTVAVEPVSGEAAEPGMAPMSKEKKKRPNKKKLYDDAPPPLVVEKAPVSTTDALKALKGQEVSITASTQVKYTRNESSVSLYKLDSPSKILPEKKTGKSNPKGLTGDAKSNRSAARNFNNDVRICVENSDPDSMRAILHNRHNHKFALDAVVLETVMKAYVMAAMFDDALYCLRNCTLPATLETSQTERILTCMPQNLRSSNAYAAADMINALCIATNFDTPTTRTYFLRIVRGIALEFLEEAMSARDRICSAPCERLVRAGTCVVDARLKRGKKASELIVLPGEQLGVWQADTAENRGIQAGDAVSILPYAGPYPMSAESLDRNMIEATITNTNPMVLRLQDKTNASLHNMLTENIDGNVFRVDKLANRMGFNRQLTAAVAMASPVGDTTSASYVRDARRPCPQLIKAVTAMDENIDRVMKVAASAKMTAPSLTSTAALCAEAIPWSTADEGADLDQDAIRAASRLALEKYGALEGLNESQQLAVEGATSNRLTLVQGPPGTGKTRIAIRILEHWARLATAALEKGQDPTPILATSDSNIAVDNLVEGCAAVGLRVVRLGRPEAIRPELLRFCIDRPPSSYDNNNNKNGGNHPAAAQGSPFGGGGGGNSMYKERTKQLKGAQIICCTCIGSGGDILDSLGPLERILVDEATQATEPAVLVPLMRGCRQLVLVGDHCQLPPTVLSTRAEEEGHGVPLFSRMVACGVPPFMLDTQYRMHPGIAMFPSDLFYGGLLKNGVSAPERRPLAGFPWPREEFPVAFIPVKGVEMDDGVSKFNEAEAEAACEAVRMLMQGGQCSISDIAVVTPYSAQARLIRRMTRRMTSNSGPPFIEVSSVDGFQGREKEAVVFSAVRSNDYGAIGFTSDWRRINVSFTRARRALIVIGNDQTLRRGDPDTWMPWLAWADAHGVNMDKPGIARGRYEPEQLRRVRGGTTAAEMLKDVLARQQAQLKQAEHQQERAVKNSAGHIIGGDDDEANGSSADKVLTLEEDLARLENTDGNWDDSDDEDDKKKVLAHSGSKATLASAASSNDFRSGDESNGPVDVWDL